jgi:precorrin-3B synthase
VGYHALGVLGLALPFGGLTADQLAFAAERAEEIRLTPWRSLFLVGPDVTAEAAAEGFITNPGDPLLAVAACPGSPACASAFTSTRRDARHLAFLAPTLGPGISLHVSGCTKGCARGRKTAATLVGTDTGYRLVLNGKADETSVAEGLTLHAAETLLRDLFASSPSPTES